MRRSLVKPIQDQIYNATKQVADKRGYGFVFDKGSSLVMIYTDPKFDISRDVLNILVSGNKQNNTSKTNSNNRNTTNSVNKGSNRTNKLKR